ncbi:MAG: hypothetical protein CL840_09675 [Crocinitomicaceae bacterium]|nr:hypothetical protein [Crocinitomicaceae bacterium]
MKILWAEIKKELLLLLRDKAGLALLFIMPALLVVVMTYIQDAAFRVFSNEKVQVIWIDNDDTKSSNSIKSELETSGYFELVDSLGDKPINAELGKGLISDGEYQVGIIIPKDFHKKFKSRIKGRVDSLLADFGLADSNQMTVSNSPITVNLIFDPLTKATFKTSISNGIMGIINELETQYSFQAFRSKLAARFPYNPSGNSELKLKPIIGFEDEYIFKGGSGSLPSSVQHNVPAWSIFAMFFIIISFSQRIVEERISGVNKRLRTIPVHTGLLVLGKALTYVFISEIQLVVILALGFWLMPILGLPELVINGSFRLLLLFTIPISLASAGLAILIGKWSKTRDQAASFGSIAVIIMAALGGVWVPVFVMPSLLQIVAKFSPLYWALEGYYSIIVRGSTIYELLIPASILITLFGITFALSTLKRD